MGGGNLSKEIGMVPVHHRTAEVSGHSAFYREAGPRDAPLLVLLHGYPTSSHMFRAR
jgi:pimeloyl-ACP methyl ester carboxylesterase